MSTLLVFEFCLAILIIAIALSCPEVGASWLTAAEKGFSRLARRRALSVAVVGLAALAIRAAGLAILPIPDPAVHDEFSHLLAADTFAHGRLANPTHPLWIHFETFHVIWHPTYASMYQPGQGVVLALGQALFGHPFWGVWLSIGLMCAAICWMLQGWMTPGWALLGGLLAVMRLGTFSYWASSYWGGVVAAIGGALVLGALPRMKRKQRLSDALLMGIGLTVLANSRPYEGLVFSLPVAASLFVWMLGKDRPPLSMSLSRVVAPLGLLLAIAAAGMGYYCWRVTGNPFRLPYQVNRESYASALYFLWQSPKHLPQYHHQVMKDFYINWELSQFMETRSLPGLVRNTLAKMETFWFFFLGPLLTLPLLMATAIMPYGLRWNSISRDTRFLLLALGASAAGLAAEVFFSPHYAAPTTGLLLALILTAMRPLRNWTWRGKPAGLFITRAIPLACLAILITRAGTAALRLPPPGDWPQTCCSAGPGNFYRAAIEAELAQNGKHNLVIVRYGRHHRVIDEWVYNKADIDHSKVVWARDMGIDQNKELLEYFKDRQVWLMEPDEDPPRLSRYPVMKSLTVGSSSQHAQAVPLHK